MTSVEVGVLLKTCRELAGIKQEELARRLNTNRTVVSRIENGHDFPDVQMMVDWAKVTQTEGIVTAFISQTLGAQQKADDLMRVIHLTQEVVGVAKKFQIA